MLAAVGAQSMDELFEQIPADVRRTEPLRLPAGLSEADTLARLRELAQRNTPATAMVSFLGAGVYDHYVPAVVDAVLSRSEFFTAYTPYQPERSQGVLQTIFEYQTAIAELTGMAVSNASMYDAGTALAEAAVLAAGQTRRGLVAVSAGVHPEYSQVLATEAVGQGPCPQVAPLAGGRGHRPGAAARPGGRGHGRRCGAAAQRVRRPGGPARRRPPGPRRRRPVHRGRRPAHARPAADARRRRRRHRGGRGRRCSATP